MNDINLFKTFNSTRSTSFSKSRKRSRPQGASSSSGSRSMIVKDQSSKPYVSAREIREKMMKRHEEKAESMKRRQVKGQKLGSGFMQGGEVKSDIATNDPNDPMTKEKLKTLLGSGAMNFDTKQKDVLAKILANQ